MTVIHECNICGGNLILTIGSDTAFCDHCGQASAVDPQAVKKYQDVYQAAETLMRTDTMHGYAEALTRLQSISFIPQAKEKAELCERRMAQLRQTRNDPARPKETDEKKSEKLGVTIVVLVLLLFVAAAVGLGYVGYHLIKGDLSQTAVIVLVSVAAVLAGLLIIGKLKS